MFAKLGQIGADLRGKAGLGQDPGSDLGVAAMRRQNQRSLRDRPGPGQPAASDAIDPAALAELRALGVASPVVEPGGVAFTGTYDDLYRANLWLRTASRVVILLTDGQHNADSIKPMDAADLVEIEAIKRVKYAYMRCLDQKLWDELEGCFTEAFLAHTSTSPNLQILASLDVARRQMELEGYELTMRAVWGETTDSGAGWWP